MEAVHGSSLDDSELLQQLVLQELKSRGIDVKLETPKPPKKSLVPFSTPSNTPHSNAVIPGRIFGRRLGDLSKLLVSLEDNQDTDVLVPKLVVSACKYIEDNVQIEGIYRMSGSAARQKAMRKEIDTFDKDFREMSPPPSVLDVASLLKQFLRELPLPIVPRIFHQVLAASFSSPPSSKLDNLLLCLLLLPSDHLACLSFLLHHLGLVANSSNYNKMTATNLAIVLTPNLLPIQDAQTVAATNMAAAKLDKKTVDLNNQKLKLHTNIMEFLIVNNSSVGYVNPMIQERYQAFLSLGGTSHSEDNLDEDVNGPSKRKSKKKHVRRRSGSLSRVLSVMGKNIQKAMGRNSSTPGSKIDPASIHSTPLPQFGGTPDYPSPRGTNAKRKATGDHELSPNSKQQKRTFESTFTPKMRTRTFSVKRFKRRKSEGKLKPGKESLLIHVKNSPMPTVIGSIKTPIISSPMMVKRHTRLSLSSTTPELKPSCPSTTTLTQESVDNMEWSEENKNASSAKADFDTENYEEVKAHYEKIKREVSRLECTESVDSCADVDERYEAACAAGNLARETRETARQMARVRRRSSENKKPRSPSQRRIGVIRRKSREREEKLNRQAAKSPERTNQRSPTCKPALTPLNLNKPSMKTKLQRGHPNTTSVGLERPSPVMGENEGHVGSKPRIKMSFKGKERPVMKVVEINQGPVKATLSPLKSKSPSEKKLTQRDSIASLRNNISDLIEQSFGSGDKPPSTSTHGSVVDGDNDVFDICDGVTRNEVFDCRINLDKEVYDEKNDVHELTDQIQNISFKNKSPNTPQGKSPLPSCDDFFVQSSPVTRAQLRRQSECFEFTRPEEVEPEPYDSLRRQSSAFEFRSNFVEPIYENLTRDTTRGSLRRRNSSVKDLVLKLESEAKRRVVGVPDLVNNKPSGTRLGSLELPPPPTTSSADSRHNSGPSRIDPETRIDTRRIQSKPVPEPLRITEDNDDSTLDGWVDASEFFKNVANAEPAQCGRSSIVKIRNQIRGRVQDSVTKFSQPGHTPLRHPGSRRLSARMGTTVTTPGIRPAPTSTLPSTPGPGSARKQTLTGIRTTATTGKRLSTYANPTISSTIKSKDKSPLYEPVQPRDPARPTSNPIVTSAPQKMKKSPREPPYQNVKVERKNSISRDIKKHPVERSTSGSKKNRVKRNRSNAEKERSRRKEERRYLTIGYPGEVRSPLKERQNILAANVRRSNSDQTPSRTNYKSGDILTRSKLRNAENIMANVVRKHSLKSDVLMSPHLVKIDQYTPSKLVKRTASERATPKSTPYMKVGTITPVITMSGHRSRNIELMRSLRVSSDSPRRSPRLAPS